MEEMKARFDSFEKDTKSGFEMFFEQFPQLKNTTIKNLGSQ